ncbi:hypothetical protein ACFWPK_34440 [Nocardia sp. NPDC058519]|uniref:hypothetical protein n=1 Tax=Nocardia sp. NPDC058519 TaxID=3346535 RepID=UPI00364BB597
MRVPVMASDRDTPTALEMHRLLAVLKVYDPAAETSTHEQSLARALHATSRFPGAYRDDSPTWITPPSRRLVLTAGESVTLDGPAVVLHLPIAPKEPRDGE